MDPITDIDALTALYPDASPRARDKVAQAITPCYRRWIETSRFLVLTTVGPEGTDASPRGDDGAVVRVADATTLLLPDWRGNNRLDSLRNIVRDGRVSLMFMVPGSSNVVRVNGKAVVTADAALRASFEKSGRQPATVVVVTAAEVYFQCAKAVMRARIWDGVDESARVPSAGDFLKEVVEGFDAEAYDAGYASEAAKILW